MLLNYQWWFNAQLHNHATVNQVISVPMFSGLRPLLVPKFVLTLTYWFMTCLFCMFSFALFVLFCLCAAVRWDSRVGYRGGAATHSLIGWWRLYAANLVLQRAAGERSGGANAGGGADRRVHTATSAAALLYECEQAFVIIIIIIISITSNCYCI